MSGIGLGISLKLGGTRKPGPSEPPPPVTMAALADDGSGDWAWAQPGTYGLTDDGSGDWAWSATPTYELNPNTLTWGAA